MHLLPGGFNLSFVINSSEMVKVLFPMHQCEWAGAICPTELETNSNKPRIFLPVQAGILASGHWAERADKDRPQACGNRQCLCIFVICAARFVWSLFPPSPPTPASRSHTLQDTQAAKTEIETV